MVALAVEDGDDAAHLVRLMNELELLAVERMKGIVEANLRYISIVLRFGSTCLSVDCLRYTIAFLLKCASVTLLGTVLPFICCLLRGANDRRDRLPDLLYQLPLLCGF